MSNNSPLQDMDPEYNEKSWIVTFFAMMLVGVIIIAIVWKFIIKDLIDATI